MSDGLLYQEYLDSFEPETPNDRLLLEELVSLTKQIETIRSRLDEALRDDNATHTQLKGLTDAKAKLLAEFRKIQDELGISYAKRRGDVEAKDEIPRLVDAANDLLTQYAVQIRCPHCLDETANVNINQGFILFHFKDNVEWKWSQVCPRCGKAFEIKSDTYLDLGSGFDVDGELLSLEQDDIFVEEE